MSAQCAICGRCAGLCDEPGERFAVYRIGKTREFTPCRFDEARASLIVGKPDDPLWYSALKDNLLILTRSTGPDGDLVVVDLDSGKTVLDVPANTFDLGDTSLTYQERTGAGDAASLPRFCRAPGQWVRLGPDEGKDLRSQEFRDCRHGPDRLRGDAVAPSEKQVHRTERFGRVFSSARPLAI